MSGFLFNGLPQTPVFTGAELMGVDTQNTAGLIPESATLSLAQLAIAMNVLGNTLSKTMVAGTMYYVGITVGYQMQATGIEVLLGATGGTDKWTVALWDSLGNVVAKSDFATGITAGTALTVQRLPFGVTGSEAPVSVAPGEYFIGLQSNGTTANFAAINSPVWPKYTGSKTGSFSTITTITPPTTYTANVGPTAALY